MAAPTFVGAGAVTGIAYNGVGNLPTPAGVADGDLMLLLIHTASDNASCPGWTELQKTPAGQWNPGFYALYKVATASEPATHAVTSSNGFGNNARGVIVAYAGASIVESSKTAMLNGTAIALPTLTTPSANNLLVMFAAELNTRSLAITPPGTATSRASNSSLGQSFVVCDEVIASAGAVGTRTFTTPSTADIALISIALEGGGGGGGASTSGTLTLAPATLSGSASVSARAAGTLTLAPATLSGSASIAGAPASASGSLTLAPATLSGSAAVAGAGATVVGEVVADPDGDALMNTTIPKVCYLRLSDMTVAVNLTNQQTDGTGMMSRTHAGFVAGEDYLRVLSDATGATTGCKVYRAT